VLVVLSFTLGFFAESGGTHFGRSSWRAQVAS
jgi:hypothetical protein